MDSPRISLIATTSGGAHSVETMKSKITRWGNALGVRIPREACRTLAISSGDTLEIEVRDGSLVMTPDREETLADLLDRVTPENCHGEFDWGADIGLERL